MKKFLALGYMVALPLVSGAKILPSVLLIVLASTSPAGVLATLGFTAANIVTFLTTGATLSFLITGPFAPGPISNWIMGL